MVLAWGLGRGRVAVLNGFGISLGDSIIGLQALDAALELEAVRGRPTLFRRTDTKPIVTALYGLAGHFAEVLPMPEDTAALERFTHVVDIRDFAFDPGFRGVAMLDYFLGHLGLMPAAVPGRLRRNRWLGPSVVPRRPPGLPERYVLFCPRASMALRDMPEAIQAAILDWLLVRTGFAVVTQGPVFCPNPRAIGIPDCTSIQELCGLVAGAEAVLSTDTAMVHLADAFSVPCLAFFVTHRPEWRVRDYPLCTPVHLPARLPEALEFARGPADLSAARAAWFARGTDLRWLPPLLDELAAPMLEAARAQSRLALRPPHP